MAKPSKLTEIESREGRPMQDILTELYEKYGKQGTVAESLGVSQGTVSLWLVRLGLQERTVIVPKKEAAE